MAGPNKRNRVVAEENSDSDISEDYEEEVEEEEEMTEIQVEFEARVPDGGDFDGIKRLLRQMFVKAHIDVSAMADIIVQQNDVGSVIKQSEMDADDGSENSDEDEDILFGLTTVLNMTTRVPDDACIAQIQELILETCKTHGTDQTLQLFRNVLDRPRNAPQHTGLVINERLVNIPPQIASPLFDSLSKEINAANEKKNSFNFDYFIMICKLYKMEANTAKGISEQWIYPKPEEVFFCEEALASFEYHIQGESDNALEGEWDADEGDEGLKPYRRVLLIDAGVLESILSKVRSTYASPTQ